MKLISVTASRHYAEGRPNGRPFGFLLTFDNGRNLRLRGAGDGYRMLVDDQLLDEPFDMGECGTIGIENVTEALELSATEVLEIRSLELEGDPVGVQLTLADRSRFHFWIDGDEHHWGGYAAMVSHDWPDARLPVAGELIRP